MARSSMEVVGAAKPDVRTAIAERAYYKAERRGFTPGHDVEDWLAAEREIVALAAEPLVAAVPKKPATRRSAVVKKLK